MISTVFGLLAGFLLWRYRLIGTSYEMPLAALFSSPVILAYPVFLVSFGRTSAALIALSSIFGLIPIIINTKGAFQSVNPILLEVGASMNLSGKQKRAARWQTPAVVQVSTVVLLVALWESIGRSGLLFPELFPSLLTVLQSLWVYLTTPVVLPHLDASGRAVGGALLLGALTGSRRSWLEIAEPLILYAAVVPKIVIFPIFILFLGIGVDRSWR